MTFLIHTVTRVLVTQMQATPTVNNEAFNLYSRYVVLSHVCVCVCEFGQMSMEVWPHNGEGAVIMSAEVGSHEHGSVAA